ncbi:prolipoprotein diacylglyceryl transferase [Bacteroidetes/Chlorobi group bacterium ChocPot_Mid]|nr:MAG: prolipoprotein diacylglyceryl transferase [Bacteroidetes/Chlorobi group bacterium ChocPot_Mid]
MSFFSVIYWDIDPNIVQIGPITIRYYGLLFALAFVVGYQILYWIFNKEGKNLKELESFTIAMIVGTVVGARLGHCLFYEPSYYLSNPIEILKVWKGGLASHGGALGLAIALYVFLKFRKRENSFIWYADRAVISISLAAAFIRIGNFFNSEIIGRSSDAAWAVVFSRVDQVPRHPSQIYEALSYIAIFLILLFRYKKYNVNLPKGEMFGIFLVLLFSARFIIEFFKEVQVEFEKGLVLDMGQILSIPGILLGVGILIWSYKTRK